MSENRIVAVGLLTQHELNLLGHSFERVWPIDEAPAFSELLEAIDETSCELNRNKDAADPAVSSLT